jgi:signal transduction histidine kinase
MSNGIYALDALLRDKAPEVKGYLKILQDQVVLASKIVDDLLGFSQTGSASRQAVSLDELLRTVMTRITVPANVSVEDQLPDTLPRVLVDPQQAGQVLFNLLTNAIQAIEETGSSGTIRVQGRQDNGMVALEVRDSGKGIAPADWPRVFQPLFTTKARGTGLGLAISRLFAQMNGGDLQVAPEEDGGKGAVFVFTMPSAT